MTVRQIGQQTFNADKAHTAAYVRRVLSKNQSYRRIKESEDGTVFRTNVKPNFLLLGTDMKVDLNQADSGTKITVTVKSQPWMMGDAFGFYERYIRDFFSALRAVIESERG